MSAALADGRTLPMLTVLDTCTRGCVALEGGVGFRGADVAEVLTRAGIRRGLPPVITVDHGTEFISKALDQWAYRNRVKLDYIRPETPTDNGSIESFNARVRQGCLSQHYFSSIAGARFVLGTWPEDYNNARPHSALGQRTPAQFRDEVEITEDRNEIAFR